MLPSNFTATTLTDGKVLFAGGTDGLGELASAELYDPLTGNVSLTEPLAAARQNAVAARASTLTPISPEERAFFATRSVEQPGRRSQLKNDLHTAFELLHEIGAERS